MRGKVAKKIRKEVYGDHSLRDRETPKGELLRKEYQEAKKIHKKG